MKAFGIPLTDDHDNCFVVCIDEKGKFLNQWTSSNYLYLKSDLATHAKNYEYFFIEKPNYTDLVHLFMLLVKYQENSK